MLKSIKVGTSWDSNIKQTCERHSHPGDRRGMDRSAQYKRVREQRHSPTGGWRRR